MQEKQKILDLLHIYLHRFRVYTYHTLEHGYNMASWGENRGISLHNHYQLYAKWIRGPSSPDLHLYSVIWLNIFQQLGLILFGNLAILLGRASSIICLLEALPIYIFLSP